MASKFLKISTAALGCAAFVAGANAALVTGVTTDNGDPDGNVTAITTADGTLENLIFSSVATAASQNNILAWVNGSLPATAEGALSDQRFDTGQLSSGATTIYSVAPVTADDELVIIFNSTFSPSFFQGPGVITAVDAGGVALGTVDASGSVGINDNFTAITLQRNTGGDLGGRPIYGTTISIADFGVADISTIAGFQVPGDPSGGTNPNDFDVHLVGINAIPEPASLGLLGAGALCLLGLRRRK